MNDTRSSAQSPLFIGVTGTNGKTTTSSLIAFLLREAGQRVLCATTVETDIDGQSHPARLLRDVLSAGASCDVIVQETTSHALGGGLLRRKPADVGVFTNLTHDHLDQHDGSYESYLAAKATLFTSLARSKRREPIAVLNHDQPASELIASVLEPRVRVVTYGWRPARGEHLRGEIKLGNLFADGQIVPTCLVGRHMAENILAALALVRALGAPLSRAASSVAGFRGVRGRFERVAPDLWPAVYVDYAHTPDALQRTLVAAREISSGSLWVVFGCGGDRDPSKRAVMGSVASRLADRVIVTSDNPRSEDPLQIAEAVLAGVDPCDRGRVSCVPDRESAIASAIRLASPEDLVLVAGKGHELTQEILGKTVPFDDRAAAFAALQHRRSA